MIIALTIITLFCYIFLKIEPKAEKKISLIDKIIGKLKVIYKNYILAALANKYKVIIGIFSLFFLSIYGFTKIPFLFFPDSDRNLITVDINLPEGFKIESTQELVNLLKYLFLIP